MDSALQESSWQPATHPIQPWDNWLVKESAVLPHAHEQVHTFLPPSLCQAVPCLWLRLLQAAGATGGGATCPAGIPVNDELWTVFIPCFLCLFIFFASRYWVWVPSVYWLWLIVLKWSASPKTFSNCLNFKPANTCQSRTSCRHTIGQSAYFTD